MNDIVQAKTEINPSIAQIVALWGYSFEGD